MTDDTMPLLDALLKRGGGDFMKDLAEEVLQRLMAYDIDGRSKPGSQACRAGLGGARRAEQDNRNTAGQCGCPMIA